MAWPKRVGGDFARLEALLVDAGLVMPPMPDAAPPRLKEREEWCFSTRAFKVSPHLLQHFVRKAIEGASPDYVLVAQAGQGVDPEAMHYYLVQTPLQLFLQIGWGGAHRNREQSVSLMNECFVSTHQLVRGVADAQRQGRLPRGGRLTVVASDLNESFWEVVSGGMRIAGSLQASRRPPRNIPGPREVLSEASRWCAVKT